MEYLELGENNDWQQMSPLTCARHLPGVGALDSRIYVCGGSDDTWTAFSTVEVLDTVTGKDCINRITHSETVANQT